jgi:hypothetical protein
MKRFFTLPVFAIIGVLSLVITTANAQTGVSASVVTKNIASKSDDGVSIVLQSFDLTKTGSTIKINWQTSSEKNNNYFEILRSIDGIQFNVIALMFAKEDAEKGATYRYTDQESAKLTAENVYYRLRIIDITGKSVLIDPKKIALSEMPIPQ